MPSVAIINPQPGDEVTAPWGQSVAAALNGIQAGEATVSISSSTQGSTVVTFPRPFASPPVVVAMIKSTAGAALGLWCQANTITATTVQLRLSAAAALSIAGVPVEWIAIGALA